MVCHACLREVRWAVVRLALTAGDEVVTVYLCTDCAGRCDTKYGAPVDGKLSSEVSTAEVKPDGP